MEDRYEQLDAAERWYMDTFRLWSDSAGFLTTLDIDMSRTRDLVAKLRAGGVHGTYTHFFVRAVALALARHPDLHQLISPTQRFYPGSVHVSLAVAGAPSFAAPVMILEAADRKTVRELAEEIIARTPEIKGKEPRDSARLRRLAWMNAAPALRRRVIRSFWDRLPLRQQNAGSIMVSALPELDFFVPFLFPTPAAVGIGRVRDRVVALDGQPAVRPMVTIACCADHKAWDGIRAQTFMTELRTILTGDDLEAEI